VLADLKSYVPGSIPQRPEVLTYDDGQIYDARHKHDRGLKLSKEARAQLSYLSMWRMAVYREEQKRTGNLILLLGCIECLEAEDEYEGAKVIRAFVREHYKVATPDVVSSSWHMRVRWANRYSQDRDVLPIHLRMDTPPPMGYGTRPNSPTESDDDDDDDEHDYSDPNAPSF
jgi:hypothetical protein